VKDRKRKKERERERKAAANRLTITHSRTLYNAFRMSSLCSILATIAIFERSRGGPNGYSSKSDRERTISSLMNYLIFRDSTSTFALRQSQMGIMKICVCLFYPD